MKRLPCILLCVGFLLNGQGRVSGAEPVVDAEILSMVRVVDDPEGQANVRSGPSLQSKVTGRIVSGQVVTVEVPQRGDWAKLLLEDVDADQPRYLHASRLKTIASWKQTPVGKVKDGKVAAVKQGGFAAQVTAAPFTATEHRITRDENGQELVDGKSPWGRDGGLPTQSFSLKVTINDKEIAIPPAACQNLYEPSLETLVLLTPPGGGQAFVLMTNSDGAGAYCVIWAFKEGKYLGREVFVPF